VFALIAMGRLAAWFGHPEQYEPSPSSGARLDTDFGDLLAPSHRVSIMSPKSFEDAQYLADHFKRQQLVFVDLRDVDETLAKRMVDFCAGLTYALGGQVRPIVDGLFLLSPCGVEVSDGEGRQFAERAFFNQF
jgi:FtsZ-interacting cell division protein YlmF